MSTDDQNNQQTRDGTSASENVNQTTAANVSAVNADANTAVLDELKKKSQQDADENEIETIQLGSQQSVRSIGRGRRRAPQKD
ncbi:hypothetical protein F2Q69_00030275 [Brassica cretica]|uniref:Uncharacterized protein n=1 Tax=Brassica cretica TaxID=69181 RepID=A0A8S9SAQ3_BRACR|nr:hypothetical protein F2Q69_00030275 [Brassica cretica]